MSRGGADTCKCNLRIRRVGKTRAIRNGDLSTSPLVCADKSPFQRPPFSNPLVFIKTIFTLSRVTLFRRRNNEASESPVRLLNSRNEYSITKWYEQLENFIRSWLRFAEKKGSTNSATVNITSQPSSVAFERDSPNLRFASRRIRTVRKLLPRFD